MSVVSSCNLISTLQLNPHLGPSDRLEVCLRSAATEPLSCDHLKELVSKYIQSPEDQVVLLKKYFPDHVTDPNLFEDVALAALAPEVATSLQQIFFPDHAVAPTVRQKGKTSRQSILKEVEGQRVRREQSRTKRRGAEAAMMAELLTMLKEEKSPEKRVSTLQVALSMAEFQCTCAQALEVLQYLPSESDQKSFLINVYRHLLDNVVFEQVLSPLSSELAGSIRTTLGIPPPELIPLETMVTAVDSSSAADPLIFRNLQRNHSSSGSALTVALSTRGSIGKHGGAALLDLLALDAATPPSRASTRSSGGLTMSRSAGGLTKSRSGGGLTPATEFDCPFCTWRLPPNALFCPNCASSIPSHLLVEPTLVKSLSRPSAEGEADSSVPTNVERSSTPGLVDVERPSTPGPVDVERPSTPGPVDVTGDSSSDPSKAALPALPRDLDPHSLMLLTAYYEHHRNNFVRYVLQQQSMGYLPANLPQQNIDLLFSQFLAKIADVNPPPVATSSAAGQSATTPKKAMYKPFHATPALVDTILGN